MASFNPGQPRDKDGEWSDGIPGPAGDPLKLADRIKLGPGERFGGSARVHDVNGDASIVLARVDTPAGPVLRLGVVHPDHTRKWRAENKGSTVELDQAGATQLRQVIRTALADGKQNVSDFRAELRAAHKDDLPADQWPSPEAEISAGVVHASRWGDVHWQLLRTEGPDYAPGGADLGPGGSWMFSMDAVPTGADTSSRDTFDATQASTHHQLDKAISNLSAPGNGGGGG